MALVLKTNIHFMYHGFESHLNQAYFIIMNKKKLNIWINFVELRWRVKIVIFSYLLLLSLSFFYRIELLFLFSESFLKLQDKFIYTGLFDPLFIYLKIIFIFSLVIEIPLFFYFIGFFFFKSLQNNQIFFFFLSFIFFYFIIFILYFIVYKILIDYLLNFLISFQEIKIESVLQLHLQATIVQYYTTIINTLFIYLILVLLPITFLILTMLKIIPENYFLTFLYRKYIYILIFLFVLIFLPPDFIVQLIITPIIIILLEVYFYWITFYFLLFKYFFNK